MTAKRDRQRRILELVARNRIESQEQLQDLLLTEGLATAQSTLSRDLRELGIVKAHEGYRLLGPGTARPHVLRDLARMIRPRLEGWDTGGNIVILRPKAGEEASALAAQVSSARAPEVVDCLACDGRILVVTRTAAQAREFARRLG